MQLDVFNREKKKIGVLGVHLYADGGATANLKVDNVVVASLTTRRKKNGMFWMHYCGDALYDDVDLACKFLIATLAVNPVLLVENIEEVYVAGRPGYGTNKLDVPDLPPAKPYFRCAPRKPSSKPGCQFHGPMMDIIGM
jgi:hypothetical protein